MIPCDPVLFREIPVIRKIIQDETWLEGERRGCYVRPDDRVVRENVCRVILQVGQQIRDSVSRDLPSMSETHTTNAATTPVFYLVDGADWEI
jgi:hypothetical protein